MKTIKIDNGKRFPNLGKVSIAILESLIKPVIGDDATKELKAPVFEKKLLETLARTLLEVENRFLSEFADKELCRAIIDLPIADLPSVGIAVRAFYDRPSDPGLAKLLTEKLSVDYPSLSETRIKAVVTDYIDILREELISVSQDSREKINGLNIQKIRKDVGRAADMLEQNIARSATKSQAMIRLGPIGKATHINGIQYYDFGIYLQNMGTKDIQSFKVEYVLDCGIAVNLKAEHVHEKFITQVKDLSYFGEVYRFRDGSPVWRGSPPHELVVMDSNTAPVQVNIFPNDRYLIQSYHFGVEIQPHVSSEIALVNNIKLKRLLGIRQKLNIPGAPKGDVEEIIQARKQAFDRNPDNEICLTLQWRLYLSETAPIEGSINLLKEFGLGK